MPQGIPVSLKPGVSGPLRDFSEGRSVKTSPGHWNGCTISFFSRLVQLRSAHISDKSLPL